MRDDLPIFAPDEQRLASVDPNWSQEQLFEQKSIFFLKDLGQLIPINLLKFKQLGNRMRKNQINTWETIGLSKAFNHWIVKMSVFSKWYQNHNFQQLKSVGTKDAVSDLIKRKGLYELGDVCRVLPITAHQVRFLVQNDPDQAMLEMGVWKEPVFGMYLVEMERFSKWLLTLWRGVLG